ncbi:TrkH family potassium uptake protein [Roseibium sediminis]|uniref:TrkH family potassium uptake protein n=1 Tax=Roseibium sediminis TaxID=1775174 RepID=UPI001AD90046|nr:TrkH family potassium uptake protein [Roseibium sediminis]
MNYRAIAHPIGHLLLLIAFLMLIPAGVDGFFGNPDWIVFLKSFVIVGGIGALTTTAFYGEAPLYRFRDAVIFVNAAWLVFSLAGAMPLYESSLNISFTDAFFEAASGLTTTGSTVLTGLDNLPPGILLWRSLLQWIGGIGVVALGIWLLPGLRVAGSQLFAIESSENTTKPYGRVSPFVIRLLSLYAGLTLACTFSYMAVGMSPFNAINHAFTTVSTGGFSTSDMSFGQFSGIGAYWVAIIFMLASSVPFLYLIRTMEQRNLAFDPQILALLIVCFVGSFAVFLAERFIVHDTPFHMFTLATFNVVSVISTTGYAANDYLKFGPLVVCIFFILTFFGGCSGSTSGGFKMFRLTILSNYILGLSRRIVRPHRIISTRYRGEPVSSPILEGVLVFAVLYTATFSLFAGIYAAAGLDLETALSASITALANVGPGVGNTIGPSGTFQTLPDPVKWMLAFQMILGRLEILVGLLIFTPDFWLDK